MCLRFQTTQRQPFPGHNFVQNNRAHTLQGYCYFFNQFAKTSTCISPKTQTHNLHTCASLYL